MKEDYLIKVTGIQTVDGDTDRIEIITSGTMLHREGKFLIKYTERDSDNPRIAIENTVLVNGDGQVTVIRKFGGESRLILEKGRRHSCIYSTPMGDMSIGIYTDFIKNSLVPLVGGKLSFKYTLDFNAGFVSDNELHITITKKEV